MLRALLGALLGTALVAAPCLAAPDTLAAVPADSASTPAVARPYLPITYDDSLTSPNTHCIVSGLHLSKRIAPVYVNGQPIGFC